MVQRVYATLAEFTEFNTTVGDVADATLRRASIVIDGLTRNSRYDVDEDGYATDADVALAFTDATCAQAAWFDETDDVTGAVSQEGSTSIGSVSIGARGRAAGNGAPSAQASRISPEAIDILTTAGLISGIVSHT